MSMLNFIVPEVDSFISGGNLYNKRLIAALRNMEQLQVRCLSIEKVPPQIGLLEGTIFLVDSLYLHSFSQRLPTKRKDQPVYLIVHHLYSMYPDESEDKEAQIAQEWKQLTLFDGFLVSSLFTARFLKARNFSQPCLILPPIPVIVNDGPKYDRDSSSLSAIIVANLIPRKGILPFLKLLKNRVEEQAVNLTITILGETSIDVNYSTACAQYINRHACLKRMVYIKGALSPAETAAYYQTSNLLISVSAFETFGMALQEAVFYGVPILALKGGNVENHIQEGENGYVFEQLSTLVVKLIHLVENPHLLASLESTAIAHQNLQMPDKWETHAEKLVRHLSRHKVI